MSPDFYIPEREDLLQQSSSNNQGRGGDELSQEDYDYYTEEMDNVYRRSYSLYEEMLNDSNVKDDDGLTIPNEDSKPMLARELSRMVLPVANYTEWYWKVNLHNLFHFLKLRLDPHAQKEIRVYAEAMYELILPHFPIACEAFEDYKLNAISLSGMEVDIIRELLNSLDGFKDFEEHCEGLSKREITELKAKFDVD